MHRRGPSKHEISAALEFYEQLSEPPAQESLELPPAAESRYTWSEQYRHECEVRYVKTMEPLQRKNFLQGVALHRGAAAARKLESDANEA